jgi:CRISPR-associated protein Csm2
MSYDRDRERGRGGATAPATYDPKRLNDVKTVVNTDTPKLLIETAKSIAENSPASTSQLRNIFGPVRQIELMWPEAKPENQKDADVLKKSAAAFRQVVLLRPKLAYLVNRDKKLAEMGQILGTAIDEIAAVESPVERYARFKRFVEFFEAILAYHKK